ncbi:E3 ubiquitin-protein ligase MIB2 [Elysia marginata]|uniref:RING-type E3 ubiquitin transferase n=1 Tax=Elysia marginata TaxID=1093978 RepID=A0AAV4I347_9GAST|nr:E3 ubiquitin-protein ligase MIB2 [Elysia marginata]
MELGQRVVRGPDWKWGNQDSGEGHVGTVVEIGRPGSQTSPDKTVVVQWDSGARTNYRVGYQGAFDLRILDNAPVGGEGKIGKVSDIRGWDSESGRSVAHVTWGSGSTNVYRMGHKGKVDLKYTHATSGGSYYKDHLPVLGEAVESEGPSTPSQFKVGDRVRCDLEMEVLKQMQDGHGGWNPRMAEYINKIGTVHRITDRGDVRVQYEGCANRWTFHSDALTKVQMYHTDDSVRISDNLAQVREWQAGHGEWTDVMRNTLGKIGVVKKVYTDGDLRVLVADQEWTFNPLCCTLMPHGKQDMNNTLGSTHDQRPNMPFRSILEQLAELRSSHGQETGPDRLVREAAQGHVEVVKDILIKYPDKVDQQSSGKTALQVASHQGHKDIVQLLLASRASQEVKDEDGDTALHYSAFG